MGYLDVAAGEVGYHSTAGNNIVKYWSDLAPSLQGQPWCFCFVSWCLWKSGQLAAIGGSPMYQVKAGMTRAQSRGQWSSVGAVGSLAIYDFGSGYPSHIEFVTGWTGGSTFQAIGGNVTGDMVARKTRYRSDTLGFWLINGDVGSAGSTPGVTLAEGTLGSAPVMTLSGATLAPADVRFASTPSKAWFTSA